MKSILLSFICVFILVASKAQESASIDVDGSQRTFTFYVPSTITESMSVPLVFVLHGTTQTGDGIMDISDFNTLASDHQFIVVYPNGIGNAWNVGLGAAGSTADDLGFIDQLVDWFSSNYSINTERLFSCGFSAGGYMSYRLACESEHCFAAVASVGGTMNAGMVEVCNPFYSSSVMCIHGTSDLVVSYNGSAIAGNAVEDVLSFWASQLDCDAARVMAEVPNSAPFDFSTVERYTYNNCINGSELVHLKVVGGGHQWPGTDALLGGIGAINQDISASEEIWSFFSSKSCTPVLLAESVSTLLPIVYPNPAEEICFISNYENKKFQLLDMMGRTVLNGVYTSGIDVSILPAGIYILQGENGFQSRLLVR